MSATLLFFKQAATKILNVERKVGGAGGIGGGSKNVSLSVFWNVDFWKRTFSTFLKILRTLCQSESQK